MAWTDTRESSSVYSKWTEDGKVLRLSKHEIEGREVWIVGNTTTPGNNYAFILGEGKEDKQSLKCPTDDDIGWAYLLTLKLGDSKIPKIEYDETLSVKCKADIQDHGDGSRDFLSTLTTYSEH